MVVLFQNGNLYSKLPNGCSGGRQAEALPPIPDDAHALLEHCPGGGEGDMGGHAITDYSLLAKAPTGTYVTTLPDLLHPAPLLRPNMNNNAGDVDKPALCPIPRPSVCEEEEEEGGGDSEDTEEEEGGMIEEETEEQENKRLREAEQEEEERKEKLRRQSSQNKEGFTVNSAGYVQTPSPTSAPQLVFPLTAPSHSPVRTLGYVAPDMAPSIA
jgi:hypothetical protein